MLITFFYILKTLFLWKVYNNYISLLPFAERRLYYFKYQAYRLLYVNNFLSSIKEHLKYGNFITFVDVINFLSYIKNPHIKET